MCCILVVLVQLSVLVKGLARKTPLRKPMRGEKAQAEECLYLFDLVYSFVV